MMRLDSPLLNVLAWLCLPAVIVAVNLLVRWIAAHTDLGTRKHEKTDPDELVTIARFHSYIDAELWKGRLQAAGVECALEGSATAGIVRPVPLFDPGCLQRPSIRLLVRAADVERASQVLETE